MVVVSSLKQRLGRVFQSSWLLWILSGVALLVIGLQIVGAVKSPASFPIVGQIAPLALLAVGALVVYLTFNRLHELLEERRQLEQRLAQTELRLKEAYERMEALFRLSRSFVDASDENQIIQPVLKLMVELSGATGASFVPIDEHGQPQTALSHGELPFPIMEAWLDYLTTPGVVDRCRECEAREPLELPGDCPLLRGPFANASGLLCLSVRRGEREFGVLNLFLPHPAPLDPQTRSLIGALLDEAALGLEGVYLRRRELAALRQLQFLRQKTDLSAQLNGLLGNVYRTLGADFAVLTVSGSRLASQGIELVEGELPPQARPFVDALLQGVMTSREPVLLGDLAGDPQGEPIPRPYLKSLVAAPLISPESGVLGAILVGNQRARGFQPRQLALLQTIAGQVALVVQNANLMAELEYKTMLQERARLAREIHDGLAQTIGFLKLQAAQLRTYLARNDIARAQRSAEVFYSTLSEAYQDARQAIDGLRISPDECGLQGWLSQTAEEFQELSGLEVSLEEMEIAVNLSPEVQAQLIRIVQEALSNVRKHAQASRVWLACRQSSDDLVLEVRDDGRGFAPEDITTPSQHGLRGMRERAELIGADFQIISRPQQGATVRIRLPLKGVEEMKR